MSRKRPFGGVFLIACAGMLLTGCASAGGPYNVALSSYHAAMREEILKYQLTLERSDQLIKALEAMTKYATSLPDFKERLHKELLMTPGERRAQLEKDPEAMAILNKNGLTAQEYLIGLPALRMALYWADRYPGFSEDLLEHIRTDPIIFASRYNISFAKANMAQLKPRMEAVDARRPNSHRTR